MPKCNAFTNILSLKLRREVEFNPCCLFEKEPGIKFPVDKTSFNQFKITYLDKIKSQMETEWHPGCSSCEKDELEGFRSMRDKFNRSLSGKESSIELLDLSFSNQCNLSCKMCDTMHSSKLQKLVDTAPSTRKWFTNIPDISNEFDLSKILEGVDLSKVTNINYVGGEPFISSEFFEAISFLDKQGISKNINFTIFTNATFFPTKYLDKLKNFKSVMLLISIDGINELANYIRTGSDWDSISNNIDSWLEFKRSNKNFFVKLSHTLQAYNIHQFESIKEFCKQKRMEMWMYPINSRDHLSYKVLPIEYRQELIQSGQLKDQRILDILNNVTFDKDLFDKFKEFTYTMDNALGTSIEETIPDLFKYFKL